MKPLFSTPSTGFPLFFSYCSNIEIIQWFEWFSSTPSQPIICESARLGTRILLMWCQNGTSPVLTVVNIRLPCTNSSVGMLPTELPPVRFMNTNLLAAASFFVLREQTTRRNYTPIDKRTKVQNVFQEVQHSHIAPFCREVKQNTNC
jgi:hypothetical protein